MALTKDPRATAEAAGARRAAILLVSLDQPRAARPMPQPDKAEREKVLRDFYTYHVSHQAVESGGLRTAQSLLEKVHEPQEAKRILANVEAAVGKTPFEFLRKADPESVV